MPRGYSGTAARVPVATTVQWFDPQKGFGFLVRGQSLPNVFCHISVVKEAGLDTLPPGAVVTCEVVRAAKGLQASKILSVDIAPPTPEPLRRGGWFLSDTLQGNRNVFSGRPVTAFVKRFSSTGGYGFLVPDDGSSDIFCHVTVLQQAGYDTPPPGAAVTCEVVQGAKGPQVSRVLAVDVPAHMGDPATCDGSIPKEDRLARSDWEAAPPRQLKTQVKWFNPSKGYGFLVPDDGSPEIFCHIADVQEAGYDTISLGAMVTCEVTNSSKGTCVSKILTVSDPFAPTAGASDHRLQHVFREHSRRDDETSVSTDYTLGTVKFYNIRKGFGFVTPDGGGQDVLVPAAVLSHSGLSHLPPGLRVSIEVRESPSGLQATDIELLLEPEPAYRRLRLSSQVDGGNAGCPEPPSAPDAAPATRWRLQSNRRPRRPLR